MVLVQWTTSAAFVVELEQKDVPIQEHVTTMQMQIATIAHVNT